MIFEKLVHVHIFANTFCNFLREVHVMCIPLQILTCVETLVHTMYQIHSCLYNIICIFLLNIKPNMYSYLVSIYSV